MDFNTIVGISLASLASFTALVFFMYLIVSCLQKYGYLVPKVKQSSNFQVFDQVP